MSYDHDFTRIPPPAGPRNLAGRTFLARVRNVGRKTDDAGISAFSVDAVDLYDTTSDDISKPFKTVEFGDAPSLSGGIPMSSMFCWVSFDEDGINFKFEIHGLSFAIFTPTQSQDLQNVLWTMKADGGLAATRVGRCPFLAPPGVGSVDINHDGTADGCFAGFSPYAPVFVYAPELNLNGTLQGFQPDWALEFQGCDEANPTNTTGDGPHGIWNWLGQNCCPTGFVGDGDTSGPPPPDPCNSHGGPCALVCRQCFTRNGVFVGVYWCYVNNFNDCEFAASGCWCSRLIDVSGNPVPPPESVPVGTVVFTKCIGKYDGPGFDLCGGFGGIICN